MNIANCDEVEAHNAGYLLESSIEYYSSARPDFFILMFHYVPRSGWGIQASTASVTISLVDKAPALTIFVAVRRAS
jgi:hypothetical protein